MKQLLLLPCLIFICLYSFAQKTTSQGYIIKSNGDSVHGFLQEEVKPDIVKQISFATQTGANATSFTPAEVKSFGYDGGNIYKSISFKTDLDSVITEKKCFAKHLVHGELDLFTYFENDASYFVVFGNDTSYFLYNRKYNALGLVNAEGNFYQAVIRLAATCDHMGNTDWVVYTEKSVTDFITDLNHCLAPNKATTDYYHKMKMIPHLFAFAGGFVVGKGSQITIEGGVKLTAPQISKKVYMGIGLHYSNTLSTEESLSYANVKYETDTRHVVISIPVSFQFNFTSGIIQPFAVFGISACKHTQIQYATVYTARIENSEYGLGGIAGIGVEGHLTKSIFVNAEWRFEKPIQSTFITQYPAVGLAVRF